MNAVGWKPKPRWLVVLRRQGPDGKYLKMYRGCKDLIDGREVAKGYLERGWESAWVEETSPARR
jgi:hypothetical protein